MTLGVTTKPAIKSEVGFLDRLAVRSDIAAWRGPPPVRLGIAIGLTLGGTPVAIAAHSPSMALAVIAPLLVMLAWMIAIVVRRIYTDMHPYVPPRWLAAARVTAGGDLVTAALQRLAERSWHDPDRPLRRDELTQAIVDQQRQRDDARKAAKGVRLSDVAGRA